jgi:hypothetical protein
MDLIRRVWHTGVVLQWGGKGEGDLGVAELFAAGFREACSDEGCTLRQAAYMSAPLGTVRHMEGDCVWQRGKYVDCWEKGVGQWLSRVGVIEICGNGKTRGKP